jgi:uncharacterized protein (DUF1499 family)
MGRVIVAGVVAAQLAACDPVPVCAPEIQKGKTYAIEIIDYYGDDADRFRSRNT